MRAHEPTVDRTHHNRPAYDPRVRRQASPYAWCAIRQASPSWADRTTTRRHPFRLHRHVSTAEATVLWRPKPGSVCCPYRLSRSTDHPHPTARTGASTAEPTSLLRCFTHTHTHTSPPSGVRCARGGSAPRRCRCCCCHRPLRQPPAQRGAALREREARRCPGSAHTAEGFPKPQAAHAHTHTARPGKRGWRAGRRREREKTQSLAQPRGREAVGPRARERRCHSQGWLVSRRDSPKQQSRRDAREAWVESEGGRERPRVSTLAEQERAGRWPDGMLGREKAEQPERPPPQPNPSSTRARTQGPRLHPSRHTQLEIRKISSHLGLNGRRHSG